MNYFDDETMRHKKKVSKKTVEKSDHQHEYEKINIKRIHDIVSSFSHEKKHFVFYDEKCVYCSKQRSNSALITSEELMIIQKIIEENKL